MNVQEFMTTKLEYIGPDRSVYGAIEKMVDKRIRSLIVTPGEREEDCGVITARDVVLKVIGKGKNPREVKVSQIASKPLICVDKETLLAESAVIMERYNIARVFVCDGKNILGIVSLMDVMSGALILRARKNNVS
jgi:CBS domain-containing protein